MNTQASTHPAWIEIDLAQFQKNLTEIRRRIGNSLLCLPVKANAYGHGLIPMALAAESFGVDTLAVACTDEGITLRKAGVRCPILVLGAIHEQQIDALLHYDLEFSLSSRFKAELVAKRCMALKAICKVHLEVDTGMHRTGMRKETAMALFESLQKETCFQIRGIYSHLATAEVPNDPFAEKQIGIFAEIRNQINDSNKEILWHLANSGGVHFYPKSHFDMVRPGLLCYGITPNGVEDPIIRPCFSLKAKISYFKVVAVGQGISYGHLYTTREETRIVTVPVGYGDGYFRSLTNQASVIIRNQRFPIAGRICMDQFMVDIGKNEAYVNDEVTLIGRQGDHEISLSELATLSDTDPREILCRFNDRIPRYYT